jgi:large subunit ribosomal protein L4e
MFAPTKQWRKWHRKINTNQKRYAVASALAASASLSLVSARGHRIDAVPEVPLVIETAVESIGKTKEAVAVLDAVSATSDVEHARNSRKLRRGKGKMRNRRHVQRRGPLVIYNEDKGITQAFRNLPGVELCHVERLNLLQLAPGGHLGRFIVWTQSAFARLDDIWGSATRVSTLKKGYTLPYPIMMQSDLTRLINAEEVQSKVRAAIKTVKTTRTKKNPLTNLGTMVHLNPYALALKRSQLLTEERRAKQRAAIVAAKRAGPRPDGKKADIPYAPAEKASRKADTVHSKAHHQLKNYARMTAAGKVEPKLEQPKLDLAKMQADNEAAAKAAAPAKGEKKAEKKADKKAEKAPAAKTTDGKAAPATDAKAAKGGEAKKEGKKDGDAKAAKGDGKAKGGDAKAAKGGDAGAKKGGDAGAKKGGEGKKGGEKKA